MVFVTKSEKETEELGARLGSNLRPGSVVALYGGLGAGKTAFVRGMARGMGLRCRVCSPTFTIVNEYLGPLPLFHFDMYRLGGSSELYGIGWDDYLARDGVSAVEWSENVEDVFTGDEIKVSISPVSDAEREITIDGGPELC